MPSILITGCSSGIGLDAAHRMRREGWQVIASCRKDVDCARLQAEGFIAPRLDHSDGASVEAGFAATMDATDGRLDAVFHNGAFAIPGAMEDMPVGAMREIFETNFFGWHHLTRLAIPVMRAQGHGRLLYCSSVLGFVAAPYRGAYCATKFALEAYVDTLRLELEPAGILPVLIQPGPIDTLFRKNAIPHFERHIDWENSALRELYRSKLMKRLYDDNGPTDRFELPASAVSDVVVKALSAAKPRARYGVTKPTAIARVLKRILPDRRLDRVLRKM